jgi:nitrate/nitrite transporter NarK
MATSPIYQPKSRRHASTTCGNLIEVLKPVTALLMRFVIDARPARESLTRVEDKPGLTKTVLGPTKSWFLHESYVGTFGVVVI